MTKLGSGELKETIIGAGVIEASDLTTVYSRSV